MPTEKFDVDKDMIIIEEDGSEVLCNQYQLAKRLERIIELLEKIEFNFKTLNIPGGF